MGTVMMSGAVLVTEFDDATAQRELALNSLLYIKMYIEV
jgi:hypothetical protein